MERNQLERALRIIASDPSVLHKFNMPNINITTMGGTVFWNDIARANGWRIQQNSITHHIRVLDPNDVRKAWGGLAAMERLFKHILYCTHP